ncbi:MAG: hypothetical protein NT028_14090 [candidate division Zixibacteria bacterium]|nr:hypothetical protein [candidate division Zixibacteria bacterium]
MKTLWIFLAAILLCHSMCLAASDWAVLKVRDAADSPLMVSFSNVDPEGSAYKAGIRPGDKLLSVENLDPIDFFNSKKRPRAVFHVLRDTDTLSIECKPRKGFYGMLYTQQYSSDSLVFRIWPAKFKNVLRVGLEIINNGGSVLPLASIAVKSTDNSYAAYLYPDEVARFLLGEPPVYIPLQKPEKAKEYIVSGSSTRVGQTTLGSATIEEKPKDFWGSFADGLADGFTQGYNAKKAQQVNQYIQNYTRIISEVDRAGFSSDSVPSRGSVRGTLFLKDAANPYPLVLEFTVGQSVYNFSIHLPDSFSSGK